LNEFIEKEGDEKWADEIVEVVGPWLMIQLSDAANFFETLRNFYEWRKPQRTAWTLVVFAVAIIVCTLIPTWLLVKLSTLSMGFTFFALFPLAVNFPEYRLLVSPTKRLFWNIPTHAEWAIKYIQAEGTRIAANTPSNITKPAGIPIQTTKAPAHVNASVPVQPNSQSAQVETTIPIETTPQVQDYGFYKAHHEKHNGHLIISTTSCRFVSSIGHTEHWHILYDQINRIEKQDRVVTKKVPAKLKTNSGMDLKIVTKAGREVMLDDMEQRDEAFSQIVGFSTTKWQVVW
jgi:hypothetical protein